MLIRPHETALEICSRCVIEVKGVGKVEAGSDSIVIIQDGRLIVKASG